MDSRSSNPCYCGVSYISVAFHTWGLLISAPCYLTLLVYLWPLTKFLSNSKIAIVSVWLKILPPDLSISHYPPKAQHFPGSFSFLICAFNWFGNDFRVDDTWNLIKPVRSRRWFTCGNASLLTISVWQLSRSWPSCSWSVPLFWPAWRFYKSCCSVSMRYMISFLPHKDWLAWTGWFHDFFIGVTLTFLIWLLLN